MAVFLTVQLLAPGVRMGVEEASEHVRDRLDAAEQLVSGADYTPQQEPPKTAREENRLVTETAGETSGDTQNTQDYQHIYEQEQENQPSQAHRLSKNRRADDPDFGPADVALPTVRPV